MFVNPAHSKTLCWIALITSMVLSGCSTTQGPVFTAAQAQKEQQLQYGVIQELRVVTIKDDRTSGIGGFGGAALGGILGSEASSGRVSSSITGVVGAIAGAVAGQQIEKSVAGTKPGLQITVKIQTGESLVIVQAKDENANFRVGDRVRVLRGSGSTQVLPL